MAGRIAVLPLFLLAIVLMTAAHASALDVFKFTGFVLVGITLPGFVLWRLVGAYRRNLVEDCAAGFAVGTSVQLIVYLASASVGLQRWSWVWAPVVLVVGVLDRDVRGRIWRRVEAPLAPMTAWLLSAACALVLFVVFRSGPARLTPAYTDPAMDYPDMAFQQALAASAKFDVPLMPLFVAGERLRYHSFFHQVTAATSWATGIDLTNLVFALAWVPLVLAGCALVFVLTQRFLTPPSDGLGGGLQAHVTWAGPLAVVVAGIGGTLQPLHNISLGGISMASSAYGSPTQNLGVMLALLLMILAVDLLRHQPPRTRWLLLVLIGLASSGSKATILPMAICGFGLVYLARVLTRRSPRTALLGGLALLGIFVASLIVLFGGQSWGLRIKLGELFVQLQPYASIRHGAGPDRPAQLLSALTTVLAWGLAVLGVLFLRRFWRDPATIFLAGFAIAGSVATVMTSQPGISQVYFYRTAFPALAVLSCVGLARLVDRLGDRRGGLLVAVAGGLGLAACGLTRLGSEDLRGVKGPLLWMMAGLVATAVVVAAGWRLARRSGTLPTAFLAGLVAVCMVGATTLPLAGLVFDHAGVLIYGAPGKGHGPTKAEADAARWLRDNSGTDDLIATNAHCIIRRGELCDSRHFWIAALSERQVLVEGWAYSNHALRIYAATGVNPSLIPFWDRELLAANDAAFTAPSPAAIERLRRLGVRWLYADNRAGEISPNLKQYVRLRQATLDATIYEIR
ncbi:hypothetical protein GCM10009744_49210 [Kribbella alba]|uniref:Uncharacterized protein n=1 Tax=Kribbella alba TaxID=190197 RepID=A0ABN2FM28_9ACTN